MKRAILSLLIILTVLWTPVLIHAQDPVFPLPAPLYLLTSQQQILRVDPQTGEQTVISPEGQRVLDFDIAPDGEWIVYRTTDGMVIVNEMATGSGYVLEFNMAGPSASGPAQTLAWSPDVTAVAYSVAGGLRIAELGAGDYGTPAFSTIQGPWSEFYWANAGAIIASDLGGNTTLITGTHDQWTLEVVSGYAVRAQPLILSYLSAEGVRLNNETLIPRTAGALAYDWGPLPPPVVEGVVMPDNLYYLAADAQGIAQAWQLPQTGEAPRALTAESVDVTAYAISPDQDEIATIVADKLIVADLNGADRRLVATLQPGDIPPSLDWNRSGTQLAFHDGRGVWTVFADGSRPQRAIASNQRNQADVVNVQLYIDPRWSADESRLLVGVTYCEGAGLSVIDVATGAITPLLGGSGDQSCWTDDGRLLAWNAQWGFITPGLFLIDPAQPDAQPVPVLDPGTPVMTVTQRERGDWFVLLGSTGQTGPQYLHVVGAAALDGPFFPVAGNFGGGFAGNPRLIVPDNSAILVAGLRGMRYDDQGKASGDLVIINMSTGDTVQIHGPVWNVTWG